MTLLDYLGRVLLALLIVAALTACLGNRRARGQSRTDATLILAAAVLIALAVILVLALAVTR